MLIMESKGKVKVAVEIDGELLEYGYVEIQEGWTISPSYDWSE